MASPPFVSSPTTSPNIFLDKLQRFLNQHKNLLMKVPDLRHDNILNHDGIEHEQELDVDAE